MMELNDYLIALFFHILFVFMWLSVGIINIFLKRIYRDVKGTAQEIKLFKYANLGNTMSIGAALGTLLTGGYMIEIGNWGWLPFDTNLWLAVKQIIWIILFIAGGAIMDPLHRKLKKLIDDDGSIEEMRLLVKRLNVRIQIFSGLIIVNIFLATNKPF
ncbi:MAG: hypothetical protein HeimC2_11710 [Candidatus Heimdallarchaeota archaeon LC_2]|nr:MAG: hypothetical protein HeimC2_11710 [Candidatus Heimdallarchaeota archaeon LC_2]